MRIAFYLNCISPHQMPLARAVADCVGADNFAYLYTDDLTKERTKMGWRDDTIRELNCRKIESNDSLLYEADVVYTGIRDLNLFERRMAKGVKTFYTSERWFKPIQVGRGRRLEVNLPGHLRMLVPSYRRMAKRFVKWANGDPGARVLAIGPWAKKDFLRMGVSPEKIIDWGYFVAPSSEKLNLGVGLGQREDNVLRLLWVGRELGWKRVEDVVRAVALANKHLLIVGGEKRITLTIVGEGPELENLMKLAERVNSANPPALSIVTFLPSQPIEKIREIMREHDLYVLASNACEGWGAALNEALEEGMAVIGTYEAGSSATILSDEWLFHAGDWRRLSKLLARCVEMKAAGTLRGQGIGEWSAQNAAARLLELIA